MYILVFDLFQVDTDVVIGAMDTCVKAACSYLCVCVCVCVYVCVCVHKREG